MNRAHQNTADRKSLVMRPSARFPDGHTIFVQMMFVTFLVLITGCTTVGTVVDNVSLDSARDASAVMGKTLVVALFPEAELSILLESEWSRQLRERGIDAYAFSTLVPGKHPPQKEAVVELVKTAGFATLLVCRLVDVKQVEREVSASQVVVAETRLYDASNEQQFWSARSDTHLLSPKGDRVSEPRTDQISGFVETLIHAMSKSHVL